MNNLKKVLLVTLRNSNGIKYQIVIFILISLLSSAIGVFIPYLTGQFVDYLVKYRENTSVIPLYRFCVSFIIVSVLSIIVGFCSNRISVMLISKSTYSLNRQVISHIQSISNNVVKKMNTSYLFQRINNDASALTSFSINFVQNSIIKTILFIFPTIVLFTFNFRIALILPIFIAVYFVFYKHVKKYVYNRNRQYKEDQSEFASYFLEQLSHVSFIKRFGLSANFIIRLDNCFDKLYKSLLKYQSISYVFMAIEGTIRTLAQVLLFIIGGLMVINNELTIGQFTIMLTYLTMVLNAASYFFDLGKSIQDALVSYNRIEELLNNEKEAVGHINIDSINEIKLTNCSFSYDNDIVLDKLNLTFRKGELYLIKGPNGSGKSTLIDLIIGINMLTIEGEVLYDGVNIKEINMPQTLKKHISYMEQSPTFIRDTIYENIKFGNEAFDEIRMNEYIQKLELENVLSSSSYGMNTIIDNKSTFSGGEKLKLSLLRSLTKKGSVVILDEPTAALDVVAKTKLVEILLEIKKTNIVIVISHDDCFDDVLDHTIWLESGLLNNTKSIANSNIEESVK